MINFSKASVLLFSAALAFLLPVQSLAMSDTPDEEVIEDRSIEERPRLLILKGRQSIVEKQLKIFMPLTNGFHDRDMLVIQKTFPDPQYALDASEQKEGEETLIINETLTHKNYRDDEISFYNQPIQTLGKDNRLEIVLVGKDGGVKKTWNRLIDDTDLFYLIDAMPMRAREMREGH